MAQDHINTHNDAHTTVAVQNNQPEEEVQASLLTINGTLLVVALSFVIFTIVMQKVFYRPISQIRQKRIKYIKGVKIDAQKAQEEAENLKKEYQEKIIAARKKTSEQTAEAINEANEEKNKILEEKKQDVARFIAEGRQKIQEEKLNTFLSLKENISGYAHDISQKILNENVPLVGVSQEAIDRVINR